MLVVISMIGLIAGITLPSIVRLFGAGAEEQAYNVIAAQLTAARALAIREGTYAGVHIQRADASEELEKEYAAYSAVMVFDRMGGGKSSGDLTGSAIFRLADGFEPRRLPGRIGVVDAEELLADSRTHYEEDGTFMFGDLRIRMGHSVFGMTVVFSPDGKAVRRVNAQPVSIDPLSPVVRAPGEDDTDKPDAVWVYKHHYSAEDEEGRTTLILVDLAILMEYGNNPRSDILNERGVFLPVNMHTGQLFPRR
jgi:type II secretory pathway pseudopilin PulG